MFNLKFLRSLYFIFLFSLCLKNVFSGLLPETLVEVGKNEFKMVKDFSPGDTVVSMNEDVSVLGIKANLDIKENWFLIELEGGLINKTYFVFVNEGQVFARHTVQNYFEKLVISDFYKYSYSDIKSSFFDSFSKSLLKTKFVKAKKLLVGEEISSLYGKLVVKKIHKIVFNDSSIIKSILNNDRYLFFYDKKLNNNDNIYKENILTKEHLSNLLAFAFFGGSVKFLLKFETLDNLDDFWKFRNFLKQFLIGAVIGGGLFEIGSNLLLYLNKRIDEIVRNSNLFDFLATYKMIPLKLDYLLKNKSNFNMEEIKIINIEFVDESDLNKQSENDIKKIDNLLVDVDGNLIKNKGGKVARLRILEYS